MQNNIMAFYVNGNFVQKLNHKIKMLNLGSYTCMNFNISMYQEQQEDVGLVPELKEK